MTRDEPEGTRLDGLHPALGSTRPHPGDQLDCPDCRALLLEAFRAPVSLPEPVPAREPCLDPELCAVSGPCPPCEPDEPEPHETAVSVHPSRVVQGYGHWYASCTCGWSKAGWYGSPVSDIPDADHAHQAARRWAGHHKQNLTKEQ